MKTAIIIGFLLIFAFVSANYGQGTDFTYQGQLQNTSNPANGVFDFEFALFDTALGGAQIGSTNARSSVSVANGIFSVNLDFGQSFPGGTRFLEIRVRQSGGGSFTTLSPRQPISSAPYSIKSLNAENAATATNATNAVNAANATTATSFTGPLAGDVTGTQTATTVARLRGRNVAATQPNNGQVLKFNTTSSQWEPANDETASGGGGGTITGVTAGTGLTGGGTTGNVALAISHAGVTNALLADGAVNTLKIADASVTDAKIVGVSGGKVTGAVANATNAATAANANQLGGIAPSGFIRNDTVQQTSSNFNISGNGTAAGTISAAQFNIGVNRILFGNGNNTYAGIEAGTNSTGNLNTFFGSSSGATNTTGTRNAFFGSFAGAANNADRNSFFGNSAGNNNTTGTNNSYFGDGAGFGSQTGINNAMFGSNTGLTSTGSFNTFVGAFSGQANTTGFRNTILGYDADVTAGNLSYAAAIGSGATVGTNNTMVLGRSNGADTVQIPGNLNVAGTITGNFPAGSPNYIQNTTLTQASSNFNISGNGTVGGTLTADTVTATDQFRIGNLHILSRPGIGNLFAGPSAGQSNTGTQNAFFGSSSGRDNTTGVLNAFFGYQSGLFNITGSSNTFTGAEAGKNNQSGGANSFFGRAAGGSNISASNNSFFGFAAGESNLIGASNAFFGYQSGLGNTAGSFNTFYGHRGGFNNLTGSRNTTLGADADVSTSNLSYATAIGADAVVSSSNTIQLGRGSGSDTVRIPGDLFVLNGTDAEPGSGGYIISGLTNSTNIVIDNNEIMARNNGSVATLAINADGGNVHLIQGGTGSVGIGTTTPDQKLSVNGNASKTGGTSWAVFSDERLKDIKGRFSVGLDAIRQLNPIRFEYRKDNPLGLAGVGEQIGFSAQEVQKIIPEAVTTSRNGYLQLNVDPILWAMVNGMKEQQAEMEVLRTRIAEQSILILALKKAHCDQDPSSEICKK